MERNIALDILKIVAAFMVVGIHAGFFSGISSLGEYLTVNGVFRIAVPLFLLINGFYFYPVLQKHTQTTWLKRVTILYLVWSIFYSYFWFSNLSFIKLIEIVVLGWGHLWYISGMIGSALILIFIHKQSARVLIFVVSLSFLLGVIIQYINRYELLPEQNDLSWAHRNMLLFSFPFFCLGYLINKYSIHQKIRSSQALAISSIGLILLLCETFFNYQMLSGNVNGGIGFDQLITLIIICPFLFLYTMKLTVKGTSKNIALYSSAIYFIHILVLSVLRKLIEVDGISLTIATFFISMVISLFIIKLNKRLKLIL